MTNKKLHFFMLNLGHGLDHFFILVFPTTILFLTDQWQMPYEELLKVGSFGVLAYGIGTLPSGWLADKLGRPQMMSVFFTGIGLSSVFAGLTQNPMQLGIAVAFVGFFASIYHPVGIAMVYGISDKPSRALAINGVAGNFGLAIAAVSTAFLAEWFSWRMAFIVPGILSFFAGLFYWYNFKDVQNLDGVVHKKAASSISDKKVMVQIFICIAIISTCGGLIFNSLTTALPKILAEDNLTQHLSLSSVGGIATLVFVFASLAQLVLGELMNRYSAPFLLTVLTGSQALLLLTASLLDSPIVLLAIALFATFGQLPVNDWLTGHFSSEAWRSRFYAMKYTLALSMSYVAYWLIALTYEANSDFTLLYQILGIAVIPATIAGFRLFLLMKSPKPSIVAN